MIVGDGPDRARLAGGPRSCPGCSLVGARSDVRTWLAAANVVAVPSRWDGMSLVPLEAMASARSVVATSVSGIVESVPDDAGAIVASRGPGGDGGRAPRSASSTRPGPTTRAGRVVRTSRRTTTRRRPRTSWPGSTCAWWGSGGPADPAPVTVSRGCYR